jgi:pimeloyl-ACP methyl ester carboxylesterase
VTNPAVSMRARLGENRRPVCLVWGTRERRFAPLAAYAEAHLPELTVERIDAGHGMNMEAPERFSEAVGRFIEQCLTSSTR